MGRVLMLMVLSVVGTVLGGHHPAVARDTFVQPGPFTTTVSGPAGVGSVTVPLPRDGRPVALFGRISSTYTSPGRLIVTVNGRIVEEVRARSGGKLRTSLRLTDARDGFLRVGLRVQLRSRDRCDLAEGGATLQRLRVRYTTIGPGATTVADYMAGGPRSVTVTTDSNPSLSEQQAALNAVAVAASRFGPPTRVTYRPGVPNPRHPSVHRVIRVQEGGPNEARIDQGSLVVTGSPDTLSTSVRSLRSPYLAVAGAPSAASPSASAEDIFGDLSRSLRDLGVNPPPLRAVGETRLDIQLDQPLFGRPLNGFAISLKGTVTPVRRGDGWINVLWNGDLVESTALSAESDYATDLNIASADIRRANTLTVQLLYAPPGGCRAGRLPARFDLSPDSVITASAGTSLSGFQSQPQSLGDQLPVTLTSSDVTTVLLQASDIVAGLQRLLPRTLDVILMGWTDFLEDDRPGLAVGVGPQQDAELQAPLRYAPFRVVDGQSQQFSAAVDGDFAALQVYDTGKRRLIVLGSAADDGSALMTLLAKRANSLGGGWLTLQSDIAVAQPRQPIAYLSRTALSAQPEKVQETTVLRSPWLLTALVLLGFALGLGVVVRRIRRRPS